MKNIGENMEVVEGKLFDIKKIDNRGSVVISKTYRDLLGLKAGDRVAVEQIGSSLVITEWNTYISRLRGGKN